MIYPFDGRLLRGALAPLAMTLLIPAQLFQLNEQLAPLDLGNT